MIVSKPNLLVHGSNSVVVFERSTNWYTWCIFSACSNNIIDIARWLHTFDKDFTINDIFEVAWHFSFKETAQWLYQFDPDLMYLAHEVSENMQNVFQINKR